MKFGLKVVHDVLISLTKYKYQDLISVAVVNFQTSSAVESYRPSLNGFISETIRQKTMKFDSNIVHRVKMLVTK